MIVRTDVLIMPVLHAESPRDHPQLDKAKPFVQMPCMQIGRHHRIELQHPESVKPSLLQTVQDQLFARVPPPVRPADRIAGVADMSAPALIVGMQDIKPKHLTCLPVHCRPAVRLGRKKCGPGFHRQRLFLGEGNPFLHHLIPDPDHIRYVLFPVCPDCCLHLFSSVIPVSASRRKSCIRCRYRQYFPASLPSGIHIRSFLSRTSIQRTVYIIHMFSLSSRSAIMHPTVS